MTLPPWFRKLLMILGIISGILILFVSVITGTIILVLIICLLFRKKSVKEITVEGPREADLTQIKNLYKTFPQTNHIIMSWTKLKPEVIIDIYYVKPDNTKNIFFRAVVTYNNGYVKIKQIDYHDPKLPLIFSTENNIIDLLIKDGFLIDGLTQAIQKGTIPLVIEGNYFGLAGYSKYTIPYAYKLDGELEYSNA